MVLIVLEALGALVLLLLIVWWTMFSGRKRGELPQAPAPDAVDDAPPIKQAKK
jgi:cbb3-type cytochrome oxidase subunit 3